MPSHCEIRPDSRHIVKFDRIRDHRPELTDDPCGQLKHANAMYALVGLRRRFDVPAAEHMQKWHKIGKVAFIFSCAGIGVQLLSMVIDNCLHRP